MKQFPHDRRAIIYLNALEEAFEEFEHTKNTLLGKVERFLIDIEHAHRNPSTLDEMLATIGMRLSHAIIERRTKDAEQEERAFLNLSKSHPHSSAIKNIPTLITSHSLPSTHYRNWKETEEGINYGIIKAELDNNATIGVIGDWGTGDPDAKVLLQELKEHNPDLIIHLGDIYSSCRYKEDVIPHFINIFNEVFEELSKDKHSCRPPILTLAGNHDYMSKGGEGFYHLLDTVNESQPNWKQQASYFCLRTKNKKWQFLGADTGINDPSFAASNQHPGLVDDEYPWHFDKMENFSNKQQGRTIFMTHHPLFSAEYPLQDNQFINKDLAKHFSGYLTSGTKQQNEIKLWLWGHNHWFIPYVNSPVNEAILDKGRLMGGSARHDYKNTCDIIKSAKHVIQHEQDGKEVPLVPDTTNGLPNHTYAIIKLSDDDAEVTHYQTPSWHPEDTKPTTSLPDNQHHVLLREYILNTQPAQKYPNQ